ncbi:phenylacetate--CoA ligase family protein [Duganella sp. BJB488]|uniref:phenylacetate--CoA ligase family protein n=1 Tax=unclassified Duganella TaxID=2636909 RepID=UPI000E347F35|nr:MULTISPECIES: phenylacetate--CoA ligase family protein [unclassified Duganella]NVD73940.1 phenylacetate--CoA ligase family protein [Duganella sp. BJB1802]RFP12384.1 phenylacetate--CoA ligase family protein [Duganella sp. BJB489]RFP16522.1 phenylacetate--CoA ligase family protein [Duganella sp. BJB488]RFP30748.1 phenylacetate--CoA ligase family protein [Duganella sp. BJB480]
MPIEDFLHPLLAAYINSPQWLKATVGRLYAVLPASLRHGASYGHYLAEAGISDGAALRALSRAKLAKALRWAIETVPAYAGYRHLLAGLDDPEAVLRQLPLTGKEDIKRQPDAYLSTALPASKRFPTFTGGSTATPMMLYLHRGVSRAKEHAYVKNFHARVGLRDSDVILALRGRNVPTARDGGALWMYEPIKRHLILSSDHLVRDNMAEYIEAMRIWKPRYISAFPSAVYPLARWLKEHPDPEVQGRIQAVMLFSENVYDNQKALLREVFDCPVLQHYGHTERVLMAASMPDDERCFFWPQYGHFELVDQHGVPITTPGVLGEIVGTGFDNQVMPFVRYRTGDMAVLSARPHPLLPGFPAVERIEGRLQEFLVCSDHRLISICTMGAAHFSDIADFDLIQYEQHRPGHFVLKVVTPKHLGDEVRARIVKAVEDKTQGGCSAEVQEVTQLARTNQGKQRMLIQHLDISDYFGASRVE